MGKIDELIQQYCPDGVEWKKIEEVCKVKTPPAKLKTSDYQEQGLFLIIDQGQQQYAGYTDNEKAVVEEGEYILYGDHTCIVKYHKGRFAQGADGLKILVSKANNPKYVYYAFSAYNLTSTEYKRHWTQAKEIEIPLPPLPVQEAIVNILDRFTVYAAELQAELQARQQQYNYYRDTLLSFEGREGVEWKKLGEVGKVCMCKRILKEQTSLSGDVPFFKIGTFGGKADAYISQELFETYKAKYSYPKKGDILISAAGTIGRTVVFDGCPSYFQDSNIVWLKHDESVVLNSYLKYCYSLNPWAVSTGGTIARLYNDNILNAIIPIPPLSEQQRIVDILDRFDTLVNDLTQGLPAEIEARQQQYEYYRDQLLTFKRKEA